MMKHWPMSFILLALMLVASGLAFALRPIQMTSELGPKVDLETMIPHSFADWREENQSSAQIVDPQQQATIKRLYSQTLSRTYVNSNGYQIMLSIAYGDDQRGPTEVHKPEICYPAQGFALRSSQVGRLALTKGSIQVTRILAILGQRSEPVTYWTTIGDQVVQSGVDKRLIELRYGLTGRIPDGMLIRVSSIDTAIDKAYEIQDQFSSQMLTALAPEHLKKLTGNLQSN